jgi:hypothetical protein
MPKFALGRVVATPGAIGSVTERELLDALARHASGDWGEVGKEDRKANDAALRNGERILSSYRTAAGTRFWIITEADRSATTVLPPDEYLSAFRQRATRTAHSGSVTPIDSARGTNGTDEKGLSPGCRVPTS